IDGFDGQCGNQLSAGSDGDAGADRYASLAALLADDKLYIDTAKTDCTAAAWPDLNYLAVEANALIDLRLGKCGGRTPLDDDTDISYTFLAGSFALPTPTVLRDGVDQDADPPTLVSLTTFPFLNPPN